MRAASGTAQEIQVAQRGGTHPASQMGRGARSGLRLLEHLDELFLLPADAFGGLERDLKGVMVLYCIQDTVWHDGYTAGEKDSFNLTHKPFPCQPTMRRQINTTITCRR